MKVGWATPSRILQSSPACSTAIIAGRHSADGASTSTHIPSDGDDCGSENVATFC
jgi:hypothetical protein